MIDVLGPALGSLQLKDEPFKAAREAKPERLQSGLILIVLVALLAGLGSLIDGLRTAVEGFDEEGFRNEIRTSLAGLEDNPGISPETARYVRDGADIFIEAGIRIAELPTPLPRPLSYLLGGVGGWLSQPFVIAGGWFAYSIAALVAARLLGGRASLPQTLGATVYSTVPYALNVLAFIPVCGGIIQFAAWLWSTAIFVKAIAVTNEITLGKATLAWLAPALVLILLWFLAVVAIIALALALALPASGSS